MSPYIKIVNDLSFTSLFLSFCSV